MANTIAQGFGDARVNMPWWVLGALILGGPDVVRGDGINKSPQAAQVTTVTVADPGDSVDISLTIGPVGATGTTVTYNTGTGLALAAIGAGLAAAINAEALVRGLVTATFDTATLTLTGNTPGYAFTVTESDAALSAVTTTTSAADAAVIEFGRAVIRTGMTGTDVLLAKAASSLFTAQVITITPSAYVAGAVLTLQVWEIRNHGERILIGAVSETEATNLATSLTALAAGINAALPANSVDAAATATTIVLTAEVAGLEFEADLYAGDEGASTPTVAKAYTTGPSEATSFHRAWLGVAERDQGSGAITIAGAEQQYAGNSCVDYVRRGVIAVESSESITSGSDVFVELGVTADNGKFFATDSATRIPVSRQRASWYLDANSGTGSLAALRLA